MSFVNFSRGEVCVFLFVILHSNTAISGYKFEPGFFKSVGLSDNSKDVDLSYFNKGSTFLPGQYVMSIYLNNNYINQREIKFITKLGEKNPVPCMSKEFFLASGIDMGLDSYSDNSSACIFPSNEKKIRWNTDINSMRLNLYAPQQYLQQNNMFMTPWQSWQPGEPAFLLNYDYSYSENRINHEKNQSQYLGLDDGINLYGFRLRNQSSWSKSQNGISEFYSLRTYIQKDYHFFQGGELTIGQTWSNGSLFDSIPFKGIMLSSRDDMLKSEYTNYSPDISGVVSSQSATVSVKRNNRVIYEATLSSGPFSIPDIMTQGGGDYQVEIKESDGSLRTYIQSADSVPELQTKGRLKYNIISGVTDFTSASNKHFNLATLFYGITNKLTLYGGSILSSGYMSNSAGVGMMIDNIGAFSISITESNAKYNKQNKKGQSIKASYFKQLNETNTTVGLYAYQNTSENYISYTDYGSYKSRDYGYNKKQRIGFSLSQQFGFLGNLSLTGSEESYWSNEHKTTSMGVSHGINIGNAVLNTYYTQTRLFDEKLDKILGLSVSIPLYEKRKSMYLVNRTVHEKDRLSNQTNLNITPLDDGSLNISASASKSESETENYGIYANHTGNKLETNASFYKAEHSNKISVGIKGGLVAHKNTITFGRKSSLDLPIAVIDTHGLSGVKINGYNNLYTDSDGFAIVNNLQPYKYNNVSLDVTSMNALTNVAHSDKTIIPMKGSVIPVQFKVSYGKSALFNIKYKDQYIPLGAIANTKGNSGTETAIFADHGKVYFNGLKDSGVISVEWNEGKNHCNFNYETPKVSLQQLYNINAECK